MIKRNATLYALNSSKVSQTEVDSKVRSNQIQTESRPLDFVVSPSPRLVSQYT